MDSPARDSVETPQRRTFGQWLVAMPRWKKIALGAALATIVLGAIGMLLHGDAPAPASVPTNPDGRSDLAADFVKGRQGDPQQPVQAQEPAAKGVFRLGFSFVAGFCIGTFVRAAMRLVAVAVGFWLVMTIVLGHYGLVVVDWHAISAVWDRFAANVSSEWGSMTSFLTGSLPTAGLAAAGLAAGLKRH